MGLDLEAFARHAKRSTISIDDVKLCARRNTGLYDLVSEKADQIARQSKKKKRGIDD
ncbi:hypothetical protein CLU79DRAFT_763220 [Phycomyces nitens]|nr:hypothetical protein CLU79DRAFT_763220 [Phycomyces nitens]